MTVDVISLRRADVSPDLPEKHAPVELMVAG
jgi:hypothetical protein